MNRLLFAAVVAAVSFPLITPTIAEPVFINSSDTVEVTAVSSAILNIENYRNSVPIVFTQRSEIEPPHNLTNEFSIFRNIIPALSDPPPISILDKRTNSNAVEKTETVEFTIPVSYAAHRAKRITTASRHSPKAGRSSARASRKVISRKSTVKKYALRRSSSKNIAGRASAQRVASRQASVRKMGARKIASRNIAVRRVAIRRVASRNNSSTNPAVRRVASRKISSTNPAIGRAASRRFLSSTANARRNATKISQRKNLGSIAVRSYHAKRVTHYAAQDHNPQRLIARSIPSYHKQGRKQPPIIGQRIQIAAKKQSTVPPAIPVLDQSIRITAINEKPHIISIAKKGSFLQRRPDQSLAHSSEPSYAPTWTLPSHQNLLSTQKQILAPQEERLVSHEYLLKPQQQFPLAQRRYLSVQSNLLRTQPVKKRLAKTNLNTLTLLPLRTIATLIAPCPVATALTISPIFESLFDIKTLKAQIAQEKIKNQRLAHAKTLAKWKASNRRNMRMKIARNALYTAKQLNTVGYCYRGVTLALKPLGINLSGMAAYMAKEQLDADPRFQKVQIGEIAELHPGDVLVHGPSRSHPYGHIGVYLGNENEASDHVQKTFLKGPYSGVTVFRYEPTNTEAYSALGMDANSTEKSAS